MISAYHFSYVYLCLIVLVVKCLFSEVHPFKQNLNFYRVQLAFQTKITM